MVISGCSSTPTARFNDKALDFSFTPDVITTELFELKIWHNKPSLSAPFINIYIGGDGTPWITRQHKSIDPTPRTQTALYLMKQDPFAAIWLGRPCYHGMTKTITTSTCDNRWWTTKRYSQTVVDSLSQAIQLIIKKNNYTHINLIGFSGGGTLAMLVAKRLKNIAHVITVSGNLDVPNWLTRHRYSPIEFPINPTNIDTSKTETQFLHLFGLDDNNVDAINLDNKLKSKPNTKVMLFPNYNHHCCWETIWKNILITELLE